MNISCLLSSLPLKGKPLRSSENGSYIDLLCVHPLKIGRIINAKITLISVFNFIKLFITSLAESKFNYFILAT